MGVCYHYINYSKREYFAISALGGADKFSGIGRTLAARAFELMITKHNPETRTGRYAICGRWHGDQLGIDGDDFNPEWDMILDEFRNIGPDLIMMLYEVDGFEPIADAATKDTFFFMQLCHLVLTNQTPRLADEMQLFFGARYPKKFAELCRESPWFVPKNLSISTNG